MCYAAVMRAAVVALSALSALAAGCTASASAPEAPAHAPLPVAEGPSPVPAMPVHKAGVTIDAKDGPVHFAVELAIKDTERQRGLMFREHLDDDAGMLFIFERQHPQSFWMKNTRIPLDMIFIDEGGTIAGIVEDAEPMTTVSRRVDKPSRYVLEVNGGTTRRRGLAAGQRVHFEGVPPSLVDARVLQ